MIVWKLSWSCLELGCLVCRGNPAKILQLEGQPDSMEEMEDRSSVSFVIAKGSMPYI